MVRISRILVLSFLLSLGILRPVAAETPLFRVYYSPNHRGTVSEAPLDPGGKFSDEKVNAPYGELEMIAFGHLGFSANRQTVLRDFRSEGVKYKEKSVQLSYNLTLYAFASKHNQFNLFAGGGAGEVEKYSYKIGGVRQDNDQFHEGIPLQRAFLGMEITFERIGLRLSVSQVTAHKEQGGQEFNMTQTFQNLSFYIPLN